MKNSALTFVRNVTSLFSLLHFNQYKIRSLIRTRVTVSVLDVKMGHTLLGVLGLFSLNTLLYGHAEEPRPVIIVSPSWLSAGASVTLNCRVKDPSAGWKFYWYKMVPDPSDNFYRHDQLPGSSSGIEQDSYIVHGQTRTTGYWCRPGRGDPEYLTSYSYPKFVWTADIHSSASLTVSPDRAQHFTSDSVSLSCEGNSTEWRVMRSSPEGRYWSDCSNWGTMNGSTCNINTDRTSDAVYWCQSGSGEITNAVNITVQDGDMILLSPARPVTEGDSSATGNSFLFTSYLNTVNIPKH
ncbi:uncharacterized protein LOC115589335 [Sparus aurata]|uniref:uncharacterized protein LOC115589335 n=1 Tax=Sparus aurata TaxID=8175 RepID=UPI0011C157E7|nr:uncharacterized protein LOC115589335 [Sparus aurata]